MGEILSRDPVIATSSLEDIPVALMLRRRPSGCPRDIEKGTGVIAIAIPALDMMLILHCWSFNIQVSVCILVSYVAAINPRQGV